MTGIETLRKELEGFGRGVELSIYLDSSMEIKMWNSVDAPSDLILVRDLEKRLGISLRKLERDTSMGNGSTVLRGEDKANRVIIRGPWSNCKIIGYKKGILPAKPKQVIPAQQEKEIDVPIYDCTGRI